MPQGLAPLVEATLTVSAAASLSHFFSASQGDELHKPKVIGSATEGALVILAAEWGFNAGNVKDVSGERGLES